MEVICTGEQFRRFVVGHQKRLVWLAGRIGDWAAGCEKPPAVVLDIDEVLLCNVRRPGLGACGPHAGRRILADAASLPVFYDPIGDVWGTAWRQLGDNPTDATEPLDPAYPGAQEVISAARDAGVRVFLVSGRARSILPETAANFARLGGAIALIDFGDVFHCPDECIDDPSTFKTGCRHEIAKKFTIVANVGDQLTDLGVGGLRQIWFPQPFY